MSGPPTQALASHVLNQTLSSIALLEHLSVISSADAHAIRSKLPSPSGPFPSLNMQDNSGSFQGGNTQVAHYQHVPPQIGPPALPSRGRPEQRAQAMWDYTGAEQDDLTFKQGDTLIIDEEVNEQWYRGRVVPQGQGYPLDRSGLFPSNYIEKQHLQQQGGAPFQGSQPPSQMVPYQHGPVQPYDNKQSSYHGQAPPQHVMHYQQQQQQSPQPMVVHEGEKKNKFGRIGEQLGHAAVNGAGFGFGASIASNVVNKIF